MLCLPSAVIAGMQQDAQGSTAFLLRSGSVGVVKLMATDLMSDCVKTEHKNKNQL